MSSEPFSTALLGRTYIVCFNRQVDVQLARDVVATLPRAREKAGAGLLFMTLVADGIPPPTTEARDYIMKETAEMLKSCDSIHNLLEGASIGSTMYRSLIRTMITVGGFRGKVFVHESFEAFLKQNEAKLGAPGADILAKANALRGRAQHAVAS